MVDGMLFFNLYFVMLPYGVAFYNHGFKSFKKSEEVAMKTKWSYGQRDFYSTNNQ